ncbi:MATE family efflux transporter [uncultured Secundilactobacillus sp.]|uniref:MATE family efflux transporter n=1 Tax=uncultured Secundilactobacillus sp. TaxID=2813935 RepID=UPI002585EACC|nr:MATE family efflux transporter [uncultured Secundilactobacillus sp.]
MDDVFSKAPVPKAYMHLALPVVLGMVSSMVYNLADTFFVAKTGDANLVAGVALGAPLFTFMLAVGDIFGLGGSALISRLLGTGDQAQVRRLSSFCLYASVIISLVITALMLIFEQPILTLLGATAATRADAAGFYRMLVGGAVFIIVSLVPGNIIRTEGLAKQSMVATICGTVLAIILDPIFLFVFNWGAAGVGLANVIGFALNTGMLLWFTKRQSQYLSISPRVAKASKSALLAILAIGIPASLTNFMQSFGMMILNQQLAGYGANAVAAMGIAQKIYSVVMLVMVGFAFGAQPLIGYNFGAKAHKRLREILRFDFKVELGYALVVAVILIVIARPLVAAFMADAQIVAMGSEMLRALLMTTPAVGAILVFTTVFQSTGQAIGALVLAISRQGVVFALAVFLMAHWWAYTGVIFAQAAADVVTCAIGWWLYKVTQNRLYQ